MNDVVSTCRSTWKQLGVPAQARADLEFELRTNLDAAASDGVDATTFVGGDPRGLAREWAMAQGLVRTRWLVVGPTIASFVVGLASLTILRARYFVGPAHTLFPLANTSRFLSIFVVLLVAAAGSVPGDTRSRLPRPVSAVRARLARDPHGDHRASHVTDHAGASARWPGLEFEGLGGTPAEALRISLTFALLLGAIRAVIVAADRHKSPRRD